jgi:hypothetical protein
MKKAKKPLNLSPLVSNASHKLTLFYEMIVLQKSLTYESFGAKKTSNNF